MPDSTDISSYDFFRQLVELPFVQAIYLYGSRAREDNMDDRVDIDLAISCPEASDAKWQEILDIIENADTLLKIDIVRLDTLSNKELYTEIQRDKVALYER